MSNETDEQRALRILRLLGRDRTPGTTDLWVCMLHDDVNVTVDQVCFDTVAHLGPDDATWLRQQWKLMK